MDDTTRLAPYPITGDTISIKSLQLAHGIIAPDVWGKPKEQPALVNITLNLHHPFFSAAGADKLDDSTIHYGTLVKKIRSSCTPDLGFGELLSNVQNAVVEMARKSGGKFVVGRSVVELVLVKASMDGEGVTVVVATRYDEGGNVLGVERTFRVEKVKIMTLVGVNAYERTRKQPLIVSIEVCHVSDVETAESMFGLEALLVQIIGSTTFETLETLADFTISQLREEMLDELAPGSRVHLRIEKPRAIAWADAPVIEVVRDVPCTKSNKATLNIFKPYSG